MEQHQNADSTVLCTDSASKAVQDTTALSTPIYKRRDLKYSEKQDSSLRKASQKA